MNNKATLRLLAAGTVLASLFAEPKLTAQLAVDSVITTNLFDPHSVAVDENGTLFVTDASNHRLIRFAPATGAFAPLAGVAGVVGVNNGIGSAARFNQPQGLVLARGGLVVADSANQLLRFVSFSGAVSNLAGAPGVTGSADGPGSTARFRYPLGLSADNTGNIFIADSKNDSIRKLDLNNVVTTVATGFYEPAGVVVGDNGDLYVADTRRHVIKRIDSQGLITTIAGVTGLSGMNDDALATQAQFNSPRGLLWLGKNIGLLVSDTGNHTVRRVYYNAEVGSDSVETFAGIPGQAGLVNGPVASARLNSPIGLARDSLSGGFIVVDRANNQVRRITTSPPLPPVEKPVIGWVELLKDDFGAYVTHLNPVTSSVFNNDITIAILSEIGTQTYFTSGATPPSSFEDTIPPPGPQTGLTPPAYRNGRPPSEVPPTLVSPQPDLTIKAIGTQDGRRSSGMVQARFQFKTANPTVTGDNAASFSLDNITRGAQMWYTLDGSDPTNNLGLGSTSVGPLVGSNNLAFSIASDLTFKVRAFKANFRPSEIVTKVFSPTNFIPNRITFGFEAGEASSDFVGSAGQSFYAPVTLSLLPNATFYSLQFDLSVTNLTTAGGTAPPVAPGAVGFQTRLVKPIPGTQPPVFLPIPPAMFERFAIGIINVGGSNIIVTNLVFANLLVTNKSANLLSVGWLERFGRTNLYDTLVQDLVRFSLPHDMVFNSQDGKVVPGAFLFKIPSSAATGLVYRIEISRPSATTDGVNRGVFINTPTNGSLLAGPINSVKHVTVGQRRYIVGDVDHFRWFNAGDFGDGFIANVDALQVFQSAIYKVNKPPSQGDPNSPVPDSDYFDAMDSSNGLTNGLLNAATDDNTVIDSIKFGDRVLAVDDVYVTFRRGLDPALKWYARYWSGGVRVAEEIPNDYPKPPSSTPSQPKPPPPTSTELGAVKFWVMDMRSAGRRTMQVPIRVDIAGALPIRMAMVNLSVVPLNGSPPLTEGISFAAGAGLGSPTFTSSSGPDNYAAAWLNQSLPGISGTSVLGMLTVTLPASADENAAYRVQFDHISASPNGVSLFPAQIENGLLTTADRSASSWGDGISDFWRLKYFGALDNILSAPQADADGDGVVNLAEYAAGTNPNDPQSKLKLLAGQSGANAGFKVSWPTIPGKRYVLEASPTLDAEAWTSIASNLLGDGNLKEFVDTDRVSGLRFYRVRLQE